MDKKSNKTIFVAAILPALVAIFVIFVLVMPKVRESRQEPAPAAQTIQDSVADQPVLVGGDRDEHGCIGSAGYMWCAPKEKCLRIWEEPCYASVSEEIQYMLADKYGRPVDEVNITIQKQETDYVSGEVQFGAGGPGEGGLFLARKTGNLWELAYDGNGSIDCEKMRSEYGFPDSILQPNFCD